jgi:hypothetical protein
MIQIAIINESTAIADSAVQQMIPAFQTQWSRDLAPVWGLEQAQFTWSPKTQAPAAGAWWVVFLDDSDQAKALAYHDLTDDGLPISKVFVKSILADGSSVSVGATHEICEMAVDPTLNLAAQDSGGTFWAYEVCDPVEDDRYGYDIGGVTVTDFVTADWFGFKNAAGAVDFKSNATKPFEVLAGGYAQKFDPTAGWTQITGAMAKGRFRTPKPPTGSRRDRRAKDRLKWRTSERFRR